VLKLESKCWSNISKSKYSTRVYYKTISLFLAKNSRKLILLIFSYFINLFRLLPMPILSNTKQFKFSSNFTILPCHTWKARWSGYQNLERRCTLPKGSQTAACAFSMYEPSLWTSFEGSALTRIIVIVFS